jgi:hypothetical protein
MAQMSEAACLLQTGALYSLRRGFRRLVGDQIFLGVKPGAFSIYIGDAPIYHFDLEGRWQRAFIDGVHYLKSLDTTVQAIDRVRDGDNLVLKRRPLTTSEATKLDERIGALAIDLRNGLGSTLEPLDPPEGVRQLDDDHVQLLLTTVASWNGEVWSEQRSAYLNTYEAIPFVPPDSSSPVILQATLGPASGTAFGGEASTTYRERSIQEFADHVQKVARLLGRGVIQCRQVFLSGPDALRISPEAFLAYLDAAIKVFPIAADRSRRRAKDVDVFDDPGNLDGYHAFLHEFDRRPFSQEVWDELRGRNFKRLILGLESGSPRVRSFYGREWSNEALRDWVASCPVELGLVIVVGAGGEEAAESHVSQTIELVGSLPLPPATLVSLVDFDELDTRSDSSRGFKPLDPEALAWQRAELKARLSAILKPGKVKVATYSPEKRWR